VWGDGSGSSRKVGVKSNMTEGLVCPWLCPNPRLMTSASSGANQLHPNEITIPTAGLMHVTLSWSSLSSPGCLQCSGTGDVSSGSMLATSDGWRTILRVSINHTQ
jgi:hypothetical protein